ncbi:8899_t:CDS:2 [Paraglomus occultum]|uniref:Peroxisomal membrane protein PEX13 n=1 Tax=Paraglomus occultum TaxID=144539 RepID=A0A9N8WIK3_9GLOM|nr:8899_t:CDS:2 [Paraglomus occultum]
MTTRTTPSPLKPWERANGAPISTINNNPAATNAAATPVTSTQTSTQNSRTGTINDGGAPAIPPRPSSSTTAYANRGYSPYNRYGSYSSYSSPYSRYGYGSYGSYNSYGAYGSPYNRYGYNGPMVPGGPEELSLTQRMEASTAAGFHMIESIVNAFGGFAQMLESTFFATHSSFMAMVGVVEQFGNLRNYLGQVLSIFALIRWIRRLYYKLTGRQQPVNANELNSANFQQFQQQRQYSRRPLVLFVLAVFGIPYLMHRLIQIVSDRQRQTGSSQLPDVTAPLMPGDQTRVSAQNLEFCRAMYDFKGEAPGELSFKRGDLVAILNKFDAGGLPSPWWLGRLRSGEQGVFPSNYVEIINKGGGNPEAREKQDEQKADINVDEFERKLREV